MSYQPFSKIQFGDNLDVTDLGGGEIRVDGGGGGSGRHLSGSDFCLLADDPGRR